MLSVFLCSPCSHYVPHKRTRYKKWDSICPLSSKLSYMAVQCHWEYCVFLLVQCLWSSCSQVSLSSVLLSKQPCEQWKTGSENPWGRALFPKHGKRKAICLMLTLLLKQERKGSLLNQLIGCHFPCLKQIQCRPGTACLYLHGVHLGWAWKWPLHCLTWGMAGCSIPPLASPCMELSEVLPHTFLHLVQGSVEFCCPLPCLTQGLGTAICIASPHIVLSHFICHLPCPALNKAQLDWVPPSALPYLYGLQFDWAMFGGDTFSIWCCLERSCVVVKKELLQSLGPSCQ